MQRTNNFDPLHSDRQYVLTATEGLWKQLAGSNILITGGTGFFGRWLLSSLFWAIDEYKMHTRIVVLSRDPARFVKTYPRLASHPSLSLIAGDVATFSWPDAGISHVIHAAAEVHSVLSPSTEMCLDGIISGARRTLKLAASNRVSRYLLVSSGAVYGPQPESVDEIPESYLGGPNPCSTASLYAEGKRMAEMLCSIYNEATALPVVIARCFAFVGPYMDLNGRFAAGNFIRDALSNGPICIKGDGTPQRTYLYAADLAVWLWTILLRGAEMRPYNVGGREPLSIMETAQIIAETSTPRAKIEVAIPPTRAAGIERYIPSLDRVRDELGLQPRFTSKEALQRTMEWYRRTV